MALSAAEILLTVKAKDEASAVLNKVANTAQSLGKTMGTALKFGGLAAAGGIGVAVAMAPKFINAASNMQESMSKVNVVFGQSAQAVQKWSQSSARAFGASRQEALEAAGSFGNLFTAMGVGQKEAADLSTSLVELAADFASFNNIGVDEALEKLRAGLVGETEPMRTLGVNLNAAAVEAYILERGIAATKDEITDAMKVQARYNLILEQSKNAQGDFARTSTGLANQQRILSAAWKDAQVILGNALLPLMTKLTTALADFLIEHQDDIEKYAELFSVKLQGAIEGVFDAFETASPVIQDVFDTLNEGFQVLQPALEWIVNNKVAVTVAIAAIGAAIALSLGPVSGTVLAIGAGLGGIIYTVGLVKQAVDGLKGDVDSAMEDAMATWTEFEREEYERRQRANAEEEGYWSRFKLRTQSAIGFMRDTWNLAVEDMGYRWEITATGIGQYWDGISKAGQWVGGVLKANWDDLLWLIRGFGSDSKVILGGVVDLFWDIAHAVQAVVEWLDKLIDKINAIPQPGDLDLIPDVDVPFIGGDGGGEPSKGTRRIPSRAGSYAMGTSYVPRDGWAYLHRGESVTAASQNRGSWGGVNVQIDIANVEGNVDAGMVDRLANIITGRVESVLHADTFGGMAVNTAPFAA